MRARTLLALLLAATCVSTALPALAVGTPGYGVGANGCGDHIAARRNMNRLYDSALINWWSGYVTAYNVMNTSSSPDVTVDDLNGNTMLAYIDKYCANNPLRPTGEGLYELLREMRTKK